MALLVPRDPQVSVLLLVKILCFCGKERAVHLYVHAQVYMCAHPLQRWDTHLIVFLCGAGSVGPQGLRGEVGLPGVKGKLGDEQGVKGLCRDLSFKREVRVQGSERSDGHDPQAMKCKRGGETKMDGKLSSESGTDPSWSPPHELRHQGICFPCR